MLSRIRLFVVFVTLLACGCDRDAKGTGGTASPTASVSAAPTASSTAASRNLANLARKHCDAAVGDILKSLREPMRIKMYVTRGIPKLDRFAANLRALLSRYQKAAKGKLEVIVIEPKTTEQKSEAKEAGLQELALTEGSGTGDVATITRGYMGLVFEYGTEKGTIPMLSPDQTNGLDFWIANKIREVRSRADDLHTKVGVVVRDGIKLDDPHLIPPQGGKPGPNIKSILQQALPFYQLVDVDLQGGEKEVDPELPGLIVLQADNDWTEKELARIDQFVMRGNKALLVIAGAVNMKATDPTMKAELSTRGLDQLLDGYGIEMKKEVICDPNGQVRIPISTAAGSIAYLNAPGVLQIQHAEDAKADEQTLDSSFAGFFRLEELVFPYPSGLVAHPNKQPVAKMTVVARSMASSTVQTGTSLDLKPRTDWKPTGKAAQRAIAMTVEGKLKSAFGGKSLEGIDIAKEAAAPSRVLVIASPQFLINPFARAGNPPKRPPQMKMMGSFGGDKDLQAIASVYARRYTTMTILAFKNLLDWMTGDERLVACSALWLSHVPKGKGDKSDKPAKKCTKEQMLKLMESGLSLDDALEVCRKQK